MTRVAEGIRLGQRRERLAARELFAGLWTEIDGDDGDPLHRCALAHSMTDVQDDVTEELRWDLLALAAADLLTDERVTAAGIDGGAAGFYPSLHLNIADCYRRLGDVGRAREHLRRGRVALAALADSGYRSMVQGGLDRLDQRLHCD